MGIVAAVKIPKVRYIISQFIDIIFISLFVFILTYINLLADIATNGN